MVTLYAPPSFNTALPEVIAAVCNGCGSSGWKGGLVPESIWGLNIHEACDRHDWMYAIGSTIADKDEADRAFLNNMLRLIDAAGGCAFVRWLRRRAAIRYYEAVCLCGGPAFWEGKNPDTHMMEVTAWTT